MSHKILIVDDESENLRALERLFRNGYTVRQREAMSSFSMRFWSNTMWRY